MRLKPTDGFVVITIIVFVIYTFEQDQGNFYCSRELKEFYHVNTNGKLYLVFGSKIKDSGSCKGEIV